MVKAFVLAPFLFIYCISLAQAERKNAARLNNSGSSYILDIINEAKKSAAKDTAEAGRLFRTAIEEAKNKNYPYEAGLAYFEMAEMNSRFENHNKTFGGYFNARPFFEKAGAEKELAMTFFGLGREQYYRGAFNQAVNHINYSILMARKYGLRQLEADALEYIAMLYYEIPYFEKRSTPDLLKALHIKQQLNDQRGMVFLLPKIAKSYLSEKKYDSALHYAALGLDQARLFELPGMVTVTRLHKANIAILVRQPLAAKAELDTAGIEIKQYANTNVKLDYYTTLGNWLLSQGNESDAMQQYDAAMTLAKKRETPESISMLYKNMSEAFARRNNFNKAYELQKEYNNLFTKLYNPSNAGRYDEAAFLITEKLASDEVKYLASENEIKRLGLLREVERRRGLERENALMDSILTREKSLTALLAKAGEGLKVENSYKTNLLENERKVRLADAARLQEEKRVRVTLLMGLVITTLLGCIVFTQYKRQRNKNIIIGKQAYELQTLMKEIHHRVKNNLQIISSLLDLQASSIADREASEAVREGKNRVQSMALIHQNLYNEGNVRGIEMKGYILHLAQHLFDSYNIQPEKIQLISDIESLNLDVDTVIPIGLVINELISNALKYAFTNRDNGKIWVHLKRQQTALLLLVKDNGNGFPDPSSTAPASSFGMKLIRVFAKKLKAKLDIYNDNGACVAMTIQRFKPAD